MIEIKTPEKFVENLYSGLTRADKSACLGALLMGLFTHLYTLTNKLYNYDELVQTPGGYGLGAEINRWFLELMGKSSSKFMGGSYSLPLWNGLLAIMLLTVSSILIVRMFSCKNAVFAFCIGGFMTAFPAVVCMFFFMFTAAYYAVGIFLSVAAAYFVVHYPGKLWAGLAAVVLIACSVGTYQSYFSNTVCLIMIYLLLECVDQKKNYKEVIFLTVRCLIILVMGLLLYLGLNRILMHYWNVSLVMGSYQGMDTMGQITFQEVLAGIRSSYQSFFGLSYDEVFSLNVRTLQMKAFGVIILVLIISMAATLVMRKDAWQKKVIFALIAVCFPIGVFLIYVMAPEADYYALMMFSVVFLPVLFLVWVEVFGGMIQKYAWGRGILEWLATAVSALLLFFYVWFGNGNYMLIEYTRMHDFAYLETMVTQIKSLDGFSDELPLAFIGNNYEDESIGIDKGMTQIFNLDGKSITNISGQSRLYLIIKYLGYAPTICGYEETLELMERQEIKDMPCYPDDGSIQVIDGVIVVKASDIDIK